MDVKAHEADPPAPTASAAETSRDTVVRYSLTTRALACISYGFTSVSITLFNKAVFAIYHFHYPNLVTTLQILVSITYMCLLRTGGVLKFANVTTQSAQQVSTSTSLMLFKCTNPLQVLPLAFFWWLYVISGVTALRYLNVPMYRCVRAGMFALLVPHHLSTPSLHTISAHHLSTVP